MKLNKPKFWNVKNSFFSFFLIPIALIVILIIALQLIIGGLVNYEVLSINEKFKFLFAI